MTKFIKLPMGREWWCDQNEILYVVENRDSGLSLVRLKSLDYDLNITMSPEAFLTYLEDPEGPTQAALYDICEKNAVLRHEIAMLKSEIDKKDRDINYYAGKAANQKQTDDLPSETDDLPSDKLIIGEYILVSIFIACIGCLFLFSMWAWSN